MKDSADESSQEWSFSTLHLDQFWSLIRFGNGSRIRMVTIGRRVLWRSLNDAGATVPDDHDLASAHLWVSCVESGEPVLVHFVVQVSAQSLRFLRLLRSPSQLT